MAELKRDKTLSVPKVDKTGTKTFKRPTVDIERLNNEDEFKNLSEQKQKSRIRINITLFILCILFSVLVLWQVVSIFKEIIIGIMNK